jgi:hypothetical protein
LLFPLPIALFNTRLAIRTIRFHLSREGQAVTRFQTKASCLLRVEAILLAYPESLMLEDNRLLLMRTMGKIRDEFGRHSEIVEKAIRDAGW